MYFEEEVLAAIREYDMIPDGVCVVAGVSGGADSVCLLMLLEQLRRKGQIDCGLRAVHVHHGLRESAGRDLRFVEGLCEELDIPLSVYREDVGARALQSGLSVETAGRMVRREAFQAECASLRGPCRLALAHHMEDSAETLLFNLCRGSSLAGLGGIRPVTGREDIPDIPAAQAIVRPLIRASRPQIEAWLREQGRSWCNDETNTDTSYTRNYLRGEILPRLQEHVNGEAAAHLARTARELSETEDYLRQETERMLQECRVPDAGNDCTAPAPDLPFSEGAASEAPLPEGAAPALPHSEETAPETLLPEGAAPDLPLSGIAVPEASASDYVRADRSGTGRPANVYSVERITGLPLLCRKRVLYLAIVRAMGAEGHTCTDVTSAHVEALLRLLKTEGTGRIDLPGGLQARKEYDRLSFSGRQERPAATGAGRDTACSFSGRQERPPRKMSYSTRIFPYRSDMEIPTGPYTKWVDYDKITAPLMFRTRQNGDILAIAPRGDGGFCHKKLARVMIDRKVPQAERDRIVLPMDGNHVIWYPGYRIGAEYRIGPETVTVLELRLHSYEKE